MNEKLRLDEPVILMDGTVLLTQSTYRKIQNESDLMCDVIKMVGRGVSNDEVVAYIKKQVAAWVVGKL